MKEVLRNNPDFILPSPVEVERGEQLFVFSGFVIENNKMNFEVIYDGSGRFQRMILRSAIDDAYSYRYTNHLLWTGKPHYANKLTEYYKKFYDPQQVDLWRKSLSLEQISVFAGLVSGMIKEKGLENVTQEDIFSDKNVRDILGLDKEGAFDHTPVKKTFDTDSELQVLHRKQPAVRSFSGKTNKDRMPEIA